MLERRSLRVGPAAAGVVAAGLAVFALAFAAGRLTAPGRAAVPAAFAPLHGSAAGMPLPQLSQETSIPPLAATPRPKVRVRVRTVRVRVRVPVRTPPRRAATPRPRPHRTSTTPVTITGSG